MEYSNQNIVVKIDRESVKINDDFVEDVMNVSKFEATEGKLETQSFIIKYSKGSMYLFDKSRGEIVEICKLVKTFNHSHNAREVKVFMLKRGVNIELVKEEDIFYVKQGNEVENVVKIHHLGKDSRIYTTERGNVLTTSDSGTNKWNGIPIGLLSNSS